MSDTSVNVTPENVTPVVPELTYEYQPLDEFNRPLGGKQVIKYHTPDELADKLAHQNTLLVRKMRELNKKLRLGGTDEFVPPPTATKMSELMPQFEPKNITAEAAFQLSQDLQDPAKVKDAANRLLEITVGMSGDEIRGFLTKQQFERVQLSAAQNFEEFVRFTSDYKGVDSIENRETISDWVIKHGLAPTVDNFKLAHHELSQAGLLVGSPVQQQEPIAPAPAATPAVVPQPVNNVAPKTQEPVVEPARISVEPQPQVQRPVKVPSGLNSSLTSGTAGDIIPQEQGLALTLHELDRMSADEYRKRSMDPRFREAVDRLEKKRTELATQKGYNR